MELSFGKGGKQKKASRKGPPEFVAVDLASSGIKAVKVKSAKGTISIQGAEVLPPVSVDELAASDAGGNLLPLPKHFRAYYAALAVTAPTAVVRHLSLAGAGDDPANDEQQIREHLGIEGDYRLGFMRTNPAQKKAETRVLAAAMMENDAEKITGLVASGSPAPLSLEISGLAALSAFMKLKGLEIETDAVGFIEGGAQITLIALMNKGIPVLVRKFDFGAEALVEKVQTAMSVDHDVAEGIVSDGSFDISHYVKDVLDPFMRQLTISRDFVERRENCRISKIYLSGGMAMSRYWQDELKRSMGLESIPFNPFEDLDIVDGAISDSVVGHESRFAAVIGAALGVADPS